MGSLADHCRASCARFCLLDVVSDGFRTSLEVGAGNIDLRGGADLAKVVLTGSCTPHYNAVAVRRVRPLQRS